MPIDPAAVGRSTRPVTHTWTPDDSMLYALAIGAGACDLAFTTENSIGVAQRAYPTQCVVVGPVDTAVIDLLGDFDRRKIVHGTQQVVWHRPVTVAGTVTSTTEVVAVHDKGKGAVIEVVTRSVDPATNEPLFTLRTGMFVRGAGGFGATVGQITDRHPVPDTVPDVEVKETTGVDQALLYRLTGDRNPLHSDPAFAHAVGFDRPILHGLCTFGVAGRVLLEELCAGDPERMTAIEGRFSAVVIPGDLLTIRAWREGSDQAAFQVCGPDGKPVLDNGKLTWR